MKIIFKIQRLYIDVQLFRKTYKDIEPSYNFDFLQRKIQIIQKKLF